jgi:predicted RNase H-like nuclease (RuvC/YqgF family)
MSDDDTGDIEKLEKKSSDLQRLIEEAKRIHREVTEHLQKLRRGGRGDHTDGGPKR